MTTVTTALGHVELFVVDPIKSRYFYEEVLGFETIGVQEGRFVWMRSGNLEILLRPGRAQNRSDEYQGTQVGMVLYTDDLSTAAERMRFQGVEFMGNDGSPNCLTFTDADGNWFQLVDPNNV
jgi:catechol 2,3-dioxygenase-like lactoylglutathione lyase family enzyme